MEVPSRVLRKVWESVTQEVIFSFRLFNHGEEFLSVIETDLKTVNSGNSAESEESESVVGEPLSQTFFDTSRVLSRLTSEQKLLAREDYMLWQGYRWLNQRWPVPPL